MPDLPITEAIDEVIVYHSNHLHVRINDRGADEAESSVLKIFAECVRFWRSRWNLPHDLPPVTIVTPTIIGAFTKEQIRTSPWRDIVALQFLLCWNSAPHLPKN
jgi:hypothetical protein